MIQNKNLCFFSGKLFSLFCSFSIFCLSQSVLAKDQELANLFSAYQVEGTMVISSLDGQTVYIHNNQRAQERLSPASTFKIANSLIAIEEHVLQDENQVIPWDGKSYEYEAWNQDQNLKTAFKASCVWAYQNIAQKVGKQNYTKQLNKMNYGNCTPGPELTTFWLADGGLKISPIEQVSFLKSVYNREFNLSEKPYDTLKNIMLDDANERYKLYAKTGAATKNWQGHGWYVGYVETNENTWFFATNIIIHDYSELKLRKAVTLDALLKKGIVEVM